MKTQRLSLFALMILAVSVVTIGCGKYGPPLPPEAVAPHKVDPLTVTPLANSVQFEWRAPERDQRGKELKAIEGYRIYRRPIVKQADIVDDRIQYDLLAMIPDRHIEERDALRASLRAEGKPARRADVDGAKKKFQYNDTAITTGSTYLYQITPINNGGVEGRASDEYLVVFKGTESKVTKLEAEEESTLDDTDQDL